MERKNPFSGRLGAGYGRQAMKDKNYTVYILRCADGSLYTGITNDIGKRLRAHNNGTASKYTHSRRPVELVYQEDAADKAAALRRELQIKALTREQKLQLLKTTI